MAYVIGSDKGKEKAKSMKSGETYTASDGSTWTKQSDGSVSVKTKSGETYGNAYTSGSSTGSSSSPTKSKGGLKVTYSGSSGSSSSNSGSNSPYTKPNLGTTWDASTDYQQIINNAVANGDYLTAAKAEQMRNQKITATSGSPYSTTNKYGGNINGIDYATVGQNQMANGASWQDVLGTYNSRYNKIYNEGMQQYADDEVQQMMQQYINANMQQDNQNKSQFLQNQWMQNYDQNNPKEDYNSKYDPKIDRLLSQILNREDFSYDAQNDPLYNQYKQMYQREGDRAMKETMAEAAAGAGGMNTYAITAAQQANDYYNSQLNDKIPQLYQLAYDMYLADKESKVQDLGILQNMDATQYGRYRDTINDYYNDKNFAYGAYQDAVQQGNWQNTFDKNSMVSDRNAMVSDRDFNYNEMWRNKEWDAQQKEIELGNSRYDQETAKEEVWKLIEKGITPSAELIAKSGMNPTDVSLAVAKVQAEQISKTSSSGGGGGSKSSSGGGSKNISGGNNGYTGGEGGTTEKPEQWQGSENYQTVEAACEELLAREGKSAVLNYLKDAKAAGAIDQTTFMTLTNKYRG